MTPTTGLRMNPDTLFQRLIAPTPSTMSIQIHSDCSDKYAVRGFLIDIPHLWTGLASPDMPRDTKLDCQPHEFRFVALSDRLESGKQPIGDTFWLDFLENLARSADAFESLPITDRICLRL